MISKLKSTKINQQDIDYFKKINPIWEKKLNKKIKYINMYTKRFNEFNQLYKIDLFSNFLNYEKVSGQILNYTNFLNRKYKLIKQDVAVINKFKRLITNYTNLLGSIFVFKNLKYINSFNNIKEIVDFFNEKIIHYYEIYKKEIISQASKNDYFFNFISNNMEKNKYGLLNLDKVINSIIKYYRILFIKNNKITKYEYSEFAATTLEFNGFIQGIHIVVNIILLSINV